MSSLVEGNPPPLKSDYQINLDVETTERTSPQPAKNQPKEVVKKGVAYLNDADICGLHPSYYGWWPEERHQLDGTARQFVLRLGEDLSRCNSDQRKNEIHLMEIHRYFVCCGRSDLVQRFKSPEDINPLPSQLRRALAYRHWHFNRDLNHEVADEYQLLSLGNWQQVEEVIPDLKILNNVGNALEADLQYPEFFSKLAKELQWYDTEEQGVSKAIAIRDKYFPNINDRVIPFALCDWAAYKFEHNFYLRKIDEFRQLWVRVEEEKEDVSEVLFDLTNKSDNDYMQTELDKFKDYVEEKRLSGCKRSPRLLIKDYFEVRRGEPKPDGGDYLLYIKEKIRMALRLGIIQKEEVAKSRAGSQLLTEIENYDPCYFIHDRPSLLNGL